MRRVYGTCALTVLAGAIATCYYIDAGFDAFTVSAVTFVIGYIGGYISGDCNGQDLRHPEA